MTDCPNAQMRDQLPDLLHERLHGSARAAVMAHVGECADCRAELALLGQMRVSFASGVVAVDTITIARAVVRQTVAPPSARAGRGRLAGWRLAAAAAVIAVGAASVVKLGTRRVPDVDSAGPASVRTVLPHTAAGGVPVLATPAPRRPSASEPNFAHARAELAAAGDVSELSDSDLRTLLSDLDTMEAVPPTEPEPVAVRVNLPEPGGSE